MFFVRKSEPDGDAQEPLVTRGVQASVGVFTLVPNYWVILVLGSLGQEDAGRRTGAPQYGVLTSEEAQNTNKYSSERHNTKNKRIVKAIKAKSTKA